MRRRSGQRKATAASRKTREIDPTGVSPRITLLAYVTLVLLTTAVFAALRHADFIGYDDAPYVVDNSHLAAGLSWRGMVWAWRELGEGYWPITWMSYLLDHELYGLDGGAFHVTNLVIHIANVCLLFTILRRLTRAFYPSLWVAAFFAVHPMHVEPVAWIAERNDLLCTAFWFISIGAYTRYVEKPSRGRYAWIVLAFALGLLSKPVIFTLPICLLLLDVWPMRRLRRPDDEAGSAILPRITWRDAVREKIPLFAMTGVVAVLTFILRARVGAVASLQALPVAERFANAVTAYATYLVKTVWPTNLAVIYPLQPHVDYGAAALAALALGAISVFVWTKRHAWPFVLFGWCWYVVILLPVSGIIQVGAQARADRYTYVSLIGIFIAIAWGLADVVRRAPKLRAPFVAAGVAVLAAQAAVATSYVAYWHNTELLFRRTIEVTAPNATAHTVLGTEYRDSGRIEEALPEFREAIRIDESAYAAHANLGEALLALGRPAEALAPLEQAAELHPDLPEAHVNLASGLAASGQLDQAARAYRQALAIDPDSAGAHSGLGVVLQRSGDAKGANEEFARAVTLAPESADARYNFGKFLISIGRFDEAVEQLTAGLSAAPEDAQLQAALDRALSLRLRGGLR